MARIIRAGVKQENGRQEPQASQEDIARVAYELYERRGRAAGHELEDWLEAERIVQARRQLRMRRG